MLRIGSIVLRVDDLQRQTEFWEAALDYVRRDVQSDDFMLLRPRDGVGPNLSLDQVHSTVQVPPRLHLDLYTEDQAGEVERLKALGRNGSALGQTTGRRRLRHPGRPRGQPLLRRRYQPVLSNSELYRLITRTPRRGRVDTRSPARKTAPLARLQ